MIIGSDFDGVIAEDIGVRIAYVKENFGIDVIPEEIYGKLLENKIGVEAKQKLEFNLYCTERTLEFQPMPGVAEVFRNLMASGHKIVIITYRDAAGVKWAKTFLENHNIPYHHIWSSRELKINAEREYQRWLGGLDIDIKGKGRIASIVKPVVFIDDAEKHLLEMEWLKDELIRFLFDRPYNRDVSIPGVARVFSWDDIYDKIRELDAVLATMD